MCATELFVTEHFQKEGTSMYQDDPAALHVGRLTKTLDHALTRKCLKIARERGIDEFSMMHGHILGFLYCRQNQDVYQRDLEAAFNVTRSSVSGMVKLMEKKGYITRQSADGDTRLKKLSLTELGISVFERSMEAIDEVEALACQGLSLEERALFQSLCQRIQANLR